MSLLASTLLDEAAALLDACRARRLLLATAEGCTGGLIITALTAIPDSSDVVERGFIAYSNVAKTELLGVPAALIEEYGAISEPVVRAMAEGAIARSRADIAVSVTGLAGPGGGTATKPMGLVWLGLARRSHPAPAERHVFPGDRTAIRAAAVARAFALIRAALGA
jgi:nicotinamide-nucleotide amidase